LFKDGGLFDDHLNMRRWGKRRELGWSTAAVIPRNGWAGTQ
jgi:hypothetical protein